MALKLNRPFLFSIIIKLCVGMKVFRDEVIVPSSQLTVFKLSPSLFNWDTNPDFINEVEYSPRITNSPDLPPWLHFSYDGSSSIGHLYGVPPPEITNQDIDVVARNRNASYEVRLLTITFTILPQRKQEFVVEFKIDNMAAKDFCNSQEVMRLANILAKHFNWRRNDGRMVIPVYLASPTLIGESHFPIQGFEAEGVIIHLGSDKNFSPELYKLEKEVLPLEKLKPCPRNLKRTSVEKYFRNEGMEVDWCSFKLRFNPSIKEVDITTHEPILVEIDKKAEFGDSGFYVRDSLPEKSYGGIALIATILPGVIGSFMGFILFGIFWNEEEEGDPVFKTETSDSDELMKHSCLTDGSYREGSQSHHNYYPENEDFFLLTGDEEGHDFAGQVHGRRELTPLPPQYCSTHPNGSPALTYAV